MSEKVVLQVRMSAEERQALKVACAKDGKTVAAVVRELIAKYAKGDIKL